MNGRGRHLSKIPFKYVSNCEKHTPIIQTTNTNKVYAISFSFLLSVKLDKIFIRIVIVQSNYPLLALPSRSVRWRGHHTCTHTHTQTHTHTTHTHTPTYTPPKHIHKHTHTHTHLYMCVCLNSLTPSSKGETHTFFGLQCVASIVPASEGALTHTSKANSDSSMSTKSECSSDHTCVA